MKRRSAFASENVAAVPLFVALIVVASLCLVSSSELHRLAFFVFKQKGRVPSNTAVEHSMESKAARQASLAHFIHKHPAVGAQHAHAATFFWV